MSQYAEPQWYFGKDGVQHGPVAEGALRQLLASGQLSPRDMVWRQGMPQWSAAGSVPGLLPPNAPGAPPPPPPPAGYPQPVIPIAYAGPQTGYGPPPADIGQDPGMRWLLPVGRSGWAIAAGYLGLFSFVVFPAPLSLIVSIIAINDIKKHPDRHGMGRAIFGLVMGIIGSVLLCFLLIGYLTTK